MGWQSGLSGYKFDFLFTSCIAGREACQPASKMANAGGIAPTVSQWVVNCVCGLRNVCDWIPCWCPGVKQITWFSVDFFLTLVYTALLWFDVATDWIVVRAACDSGTLDNSIISDHVPCVWYLFAIIGLFLAIASSILDLIGFICSFQIWCHLKEDDYAVDDFCMSRCDRCCCDNCDRCYNCGRHWKCGCSLYTRKETLSAITLWLHTSFMVAFVYFFPNGQCTSKALLRAVVLSLSTSIASAIWGVVVSIFRLYHHVGVRIHRRDCLGRYRCLNGNGIVAYPPDTCCACCLIGLCIELPIRILGIILATALTVATGTVVLMDAPDNCSNN